MPRKTRGKKRTYVSDEESSSDDSSSSDSEYDSSDRSDDEEPPRKRRKQSKNKSKAKKSKKRKKSKSKSKKSKKKKNKSISYDKNDIGDLLHDNNNSLILENEDETEYKKFECSGKLLTVWTANVSKGKKKKRDKNGSKDETKYHSKISCEKAAQEQILICLCFVVSTCYKKNKQAISLLNKTKHTKQQKNNRNQSKKDSQL